MNISAPFMARPIKTISAHACHCVGRNPGIFQITAVAPLPSMDLPTIVVFCAQLPGASPNTVATSVACAAQTPSGADRRRHRDDLAQCIWRGTGITLQFDINRDIDGAARDVEAAINAARTQACPPDLPQQSDLPQYNPADAPILNLALTSKTMTPGQIYDVASNVLAQRLSQLRGIGNVNINGSSPLAVRVQLNPQALYKYGIGLDVRRACRS